MNGPLEIKVGPFILVTAILLVAIAWWTAFEAPCSMFDGKPISEVPYRCVRGDR